MPTHQEKKTNDATFLTSVGGQGASKKKQTKFEAEHNHNLDDEAELEQILMKLTEGTKDLEQIDLQNAEYSDDDEQIYFSDKQLIEHLFRIEETNLFNINLCQNDEEQLELLKKESNARIAEMRRKLQDQEENIKALEESKSLMQLKHQFFMNN